MVRGLKSGCCLPPCLKINSFIFITSPPYRRHSRHRSSVLSKMVAIDRRGLVDSLFDALRCNFQQKGTASSGTALHHVPRQHSVVFGSSGKTGKWPPCFRLPLPSVNDSIESYSNLIAIPESPSLEPGSCAQAEQIERERWFGGK